MWFHFCLLELEFHYASYICRQEIFFQFQNYSATMSSNIFLPQSPSLSLCLSACLSSFGTSIALMLDWLIFSHTTLRLCLFISWPFFLCMLQLIRFSCLVFKFTNISPTLSKLLLNPSREFPFANILFIRSRIFSWFFSIVLFSDKIPLFLYPFL